MEITTDVTLKGKIWADLIDNLKGVVFDSQWQIYALCASIGIMLDEQKEPEGASEEEPRYIPRSVLLHPENVALLDFLFQTAILTTRWVAFDEDKRLDLAFGSEKSDFNKLAFITRFANYGAIKIKDSIEGIDNINAILESLMVYLNELYMPTPDDVELELEDDE